jgi:hypothetical protein
MSAKGVIVAALMAGGMTSSIAEELLGTYLEEATQPSAGAIRQRAWRDRKKRLTPSQRDAASQRDAPRRQDNKNNNLERLGETPPLETPIKKKKDSKSLYFGTESESAKVVFDSPAVGQESYGYTSEDGSVQFTAVEVAKICSDCYSLTNVYGQIRSLSEGPWIGAMRPLDRKRAVENKIRKLHRNRIEVVHAAPQEQKQSILSQADADYARREIQRKKAIAMREARG